jgi:hypothetical protein
LAYSKKVTDRFYEVLNSPKQFSVGRFDPNDPTVATGMTGAPACGDVMKLDLKIDPGNNRIVDVRLSYDKGLDRYYGLLDLALASGIFEKSSTRIKLPNGKTEFGKTINNNPEKYFTDDVMKRLETVVQGYFKYGNENRTNDTEESDSE